MGDERDERERERERSGNIGLPFQVSIVIYKIVVRQNESDCSCTFSRMNNNEK